MRNITTVFIFLVATALARADQTIESVQQALKDQGFYYGEVTGKKDADTTAAIRRYQIRNGLQITGEINAETQKSLGVKGNSATPRATPLPARSSPPRDASDPRDQILRPPSQPAAPAP